MQASFTFLDLEKNVFLLHLKYKHDFHGTSAIAVRSYGVFTMVDTETDNETNGITYIVSLQCELLHKVLCNLFQSVSLSRSVNRPLLKKSHAHRRCFQSSAEKTKTKIIPLHEHYCIPFFFRVLVILLTVFIYYCSLCPKTSR